MFLQQSHRPTGLSGDQPDSGFLLLEALDQTTKLPELIRIRRHRTTGQIKTVGVAVLLEQFCHVKAMPGLGQAIGLLDAALQDCWPERIPFLLREAELTCHVAVVLHGVIQPLLPMGQTMAALINHDRGGGREIVEQAGRLAPSQTHQATKTFGGASLKKLFSGFIPQQPIQPLRHGVPQLIGHQRTESRGGELQALHGI